MVTNTIQIYRFPAPFSPKQSEFYFELVPGYWAEVRLIWSERCNKFYPDYRIMRTPPFRHYKTFKKTTAKSFNYHVGKSAEEVKGILLRRMDRELRDEVKAATRRRDDINKDLRYLNRVRKIAKKTEGELK